MGERGPFPSSARDALRLAAEIATVEGFDKPENAKAIEKMVTKLYMQITLTDNSEAEDLFLEFVGIPRGQNTEDLVMKVSNILPDLCKIYL